MESESQLKQLLAEAAASLKEANEKIETTEIEFHNIQAVHQQIFEIEELSKQTRHSLLSVDAICINFSC